MEERWQRPYLGQIEGGRTADVNQSWTHIHSLATELWRELVKMTVVCKTHKKKGVQWILQGSRQTYGGGTSSILNWFITQFSYQKLVSTLLFIIDTIVAIAYAEKHGNELFLFILILIITHDASQSCPKSSQHEMHCKPFAQFDLPIVFQNNSLTNKYANSPLKYIRMHPDKQIDKQSYIVIYVCRLISD